MLRLAPVAIACAAALLASSNAAAARPSLHCHSADLRYPFQPDGINAFGVFKLTVTGSAAGRPIASRTRG